MPLYSTPLPAGWTQADVAFVARAAGLAVDGMNVTNQNVNLICVVDQPPSLVAAWQAAVTGAPPITPQRNQETVLANASNAMTALQAVIDKATYNVANVAFAQTAIRDLQADMKTLARVQRRLIRLLTSDFQATD